MTPGDLAILLCGERMVLRPEGMLYWERMKTLIGADIHLGQVCPSGERAIDASEEAARIDLKRLTKATETTGAHRLVLLGDLVDARVGLNSRTAAHVSGWRAHHPGLEILHIRGNHDFAVGDPPQVWEMTSVDEPYLEKPFVLRHYPRRSPDGYTLAGHLHPGVIHTGADGQKRRLRSFVFGEDLGLIPAFGICTESWTIKPRKGDRVYVLVDNEVVRIN
jgi:DNA ligase-associated metallophosphoesterase